MEDSLEVVVVVDGPVPVSGVCLLDVDQREVGQAAEALHHTVELSQIGHERGQVQLPKFSTCNGDNVITAIVQCQQRRQR